MLQFRITVISLIMIEKTYILSFGVQDIAQGYRQRLLKKIRKDDQDRIIS